MVNRAGDVKLNSKIVFSSVRAIVNLSISEHGLNIVNSFSKVYLPSIDNELRMSIPMDKICLLQIQVFMKKKVLNEI